FKSNLQACGTKSAKRHLRKLSGKERRFKKNTNHVISKFIVSYAARHLMGIGLEDLYSFKVTVRKEQRDKFGKWAFNELGQFITYKAAIAGVPVVKINPRNTSRTCSKCGHCEKANRKTQDQFECISCEFKINADLNAAINIA